MNHLFVEDIYDSATNKNLKSKIPGDSNMILLQVCWDTADMFNFSGTSIMCVASLLFYYELPTES